MQQQYSVGYGVAKRLRTLAASERERAAIERLLDFKGDEQDLRLASAMLERHGEGDDARELLSIL